MTTVLERTRRYCERAGMGPEEPHRLALEGVSVGIDGMNERIERLGAVSTQQGNLVAQHAAEGATKAVRIEIRRMVLAAHGLRGVLYVVGVLVVGAACYWAGAQRTVQTNIGPLSPASLELLQANDVNMALANCRPQPPQNGQEWCQAGFWRPRQPPRPDGVRR